MASKDKPMVTPTAQSIREKISTIPSRMTMRFAEEAKNEMNRIKSGKASDYETESVSKKAAASAASKSAAAADAKKAMKSEIDKMNAQMNDGLSRLKSGKASSYEIEALERAAKKKK
jgi:hypothetical protein